ncbi:MAG: biotin/lipoyl-containing protein [Prevotella sp.]|jgi:biotin carboxyl carrier protein
MKNFKYTISGKEYKVEINDINEETNVANVLVNGEAFEVEMEKPAEPEKKKVELGKPVAEESKDNGSTTSTANVNTANAIKAPLPGTITAINVNVGDEVKAGDALLVLEAMKMANNIEAEKDGKVTAICVKVGQSVMEDDALVVVE